MSYEFKKLSEVEAIEEFPEEGASVLIEHEGNIKRCPADGLGGGGEITKMNVSVNPETEDFEFQLDDGRTPDEFMEDYESGKILPMILCDFSFQTGVESKSIAYFTTYQHYTDEFESPEYSGLKSLMYFCLGGGGVMLANYSESTGEIFDHFEWKYLHG